jgi:hypothetical protein
MDIKNIFSFIKVMYADMGNVKEKKKHSNIKSGVWGYSSVVKSFCLACTGPGFSPHHWKKRQGRQSPTSPPTQR